MILYIMQERRNPFSEYYDWIKTLPFDMSPHLIFLNDDDLSWMEGSTLKFEAVMNRNGVLNEFNTLVEKYPGFNKMYSSKEFMETYKFVTAKAF